MEHGFGVSLYYYTVFFPNYPELNKRLQQLNLLTTTINITFTRLLRDDSAKCIEFVSTLLDGYEPGALCISFEIRKFDILFFY